MQIHFAYRGAKVLYDFLVSNRVTGTFLLPANICQSVPDTFREAGCEVHFVDMDPETLCIDEQQVLSLIDQYAGVLAVHTYGVERSFDAFYRRVRGANPKAIIIDDRCLCMPNIEHLEDYDQVEADLTLFSFGDKKQVQLGEGGAGLVKGKEIGKVRVEANSMFENRDWEWDRDAYLRQKQVAMAHVAQMQTIYTESLPKHIQLPMEYNNWRFNIRIQAEQKEQILQALFAQGLFASSHYRSLADNAEFITPNAVRFQHEVINLFVDPQFYTEAQAQQTCAIINDILNV